MDKDLSELPKNLPIPKDDGKANHLEGMIIPGRILQQITGGLVNTKEDSRKFLILCFFPMISDSEKSLPLGWDDIPGARGCTPQNIAISQHVKSFERYNSIIVGISTQDKEELRKISFERKFLHTLVSDIDLQFRKKFNIPVFQVREKTMYKRITLIVKESRVLKVFYPIFPPDKHADALIEWLEINSRNS